LMAVSAHVDAQRAEIERERLDERDADSGLAAREAAVARRESDAQAALAEAARLQADAAAREQAVAEREWALSQQGPVQALASSDYEAQARALTEAVKAVAKHEAETVLQAAHDQARLILESAHAERDNLAPFGARQLQSHPEESDL
jgi:hypothetical protein